MSKVVRALHMIVLGVGNDRREIMPGTLVELDDEQHAELKAQGAIQDPREYDREQRAAASQEGSEAVSQVAQPEEATTAQEAQPRAAAQTPPAGNLAASRNATDSTVDRGKPATEDKDEL